MVKITVESAVIMKPGDRMIHRSQQNNPQVSYTQTGKQTKENNVSINASKETCVANGFSETVGSEGVTLPLH